MLIVEIIALDNGAHRNQNSSLSVENIPDGWAVVPEEMKLENFPFGEVTAEEIDGVMTVTNWIPGVVPEPEPEPEPQPEPEYATKDDLQAVYDELAAAFTEGVNSIDE